MSPPETGPTRVGDIVQAFLEGKGVAPQLRRMTVLDAWPGVVGDAIAGVTRARSVSDAVLFVEVRSSAWLMELDMMKGEILGRLNEGRDSDEKIDKLVFVLAEAPGGALHSTS